MHIAWKSTCSTGDWHLCFIVYTQAVYEQLCDWEVASFVKVLHESLEIIETALLLMRKYVLTKIGALDWPDFAQMHRSKIQLVWTERNFKLVMFYICAWEGETDRDRWAIDCHQISVFVSGMSVLKMHASQRSICVTVANSTLCRRKSSFLKV